MVYSSSFSDLLPAYRTWLTLLGRKPSTIHAHVLTVRRVLKCGVLLTSPTNFQDYIVEQLNANISTSHVNNTIGCIRVFCRFLQEKGVEFDEALSTIKEVKDRTRPRATMSDSEIEAFLTLPYPQKNPNSKWAKANLKRSKAVKAWHVWTVFWSICAYSGMRTGEVAKLTVNDVDFGRSVFTIGDTKTNTPRMVPISSPIMETLEDYTKSLTGSYLFPCKRGGTKKTYGLPIVDSTDWLYNFKKRINILGIKRTNLTPYSLRHSAATRWLEEDMNIIKVKKILGHSNVKTTEIYTHYTTKDIIEAVERKDRLVLKYKTPEEKLRLLREVAQEVGLLDDRGVETKITSDEFTIKIKKKEKEDN